MTDEPTYDDDPRLRERLRAADPAASLAPADPDRVARLLEATMSSTDHETTTRDDARDGSGRRPPLGWLAAAAAVLVAGGVAVGVTAGGDEEPPTAGGGSDTPAVTTLAAPTAQGGRCMVPTAEVLAGQEVAFLGTVDDVADDTVVLTVDEQYAGAGADQVRVESPPEQMEVLAGAVDFRDGEQYLVSATDGQVTVCGFSGPATAELQALYDEAFAG